MEVQAPGGGVEVLDMKSVRVTTSFILTGALLGGLAFIVPAQAGLQEPPTAAVTALGSTATSGAAAPGLTRRGAQLQLDGKPVRLSGVNGFSLTTWWATNWGCGTQVDDLDAFFSKVGRGALVRTWAFQSLGFDNKRAQALDFSAIDRVVQAAERNGVLLDLALSDQAGTCDDGRWHDRAWYAGGYKQVRNDDGRGLTPLPYDQWVQRVVSRYASSPAVAIYEPVNEPEAADCRADLRGGACFGSAPCPPDAADVLRRFFDEIGGTIHRLDPNALVSSGVIGSSQCGMAGGGFSRVHSSSGIDIASFHDYGAPRQALTGELATRIREATALSKPLLVGEVGVGGSNDADTINRGCPSLGERAQLHLAKRGAAFDAGADGYLPWWFAPGREGGCTDSLTWDDPLLTQLTSIVRTRRVWPWWRTSVRPPAVAAVSAAESVVPD